MVTRKTSLQWNNNYVTSVLCSAHIAFQCTPFIKSGSKHYLGIMNSAVTFRKLQHVSKGSKHCRSASNTLVRIFHQS